MRVIVALGLIAALAACSTEDRLRGSEFEPYADGTFRYRADVYYPYDDADRIEWLETALKENSYCPDGYEITDKKEIVRASTVLGDAKSQIFYGRCK
ncbi:hypothetical protein [Thalassospira marina]|uniref:Lipoprotein n=1 Tax=Thalassospira marina TaxID=2048283 RepID=A0A2N3KV19_9PROT|nr:hypothetical protein [Thalassospira marina]PKR54404.1 hypothetical protein COO20_09750 [Thalassospira marina]